MSWAHLHVHSVHSNSDSLCKHDDIIARSIELGMSHVALTDHGTMAGVPEFVKACEGANEKAKQQLITPIIGYEAYVFMHPVLDQIGKEHVGKQDTGHLTLLAKNEIGYANLVRLASIGFKDYVFRMKPRVSIDDVLKHHEGIICLTGCMYSWMNLWILRHHHITRDWTRDKESLSKSDPYYYYIQDGIIDPKTEIVTPIEKPYNGEFLQDVEQRFRCLKKVFKDDLYIEVQDHNLFQQEDIRKFWENRFPNEKFVGTNDVHYINREDWQAQEFLTRVRFHSSTDEAYSWRVLNELNEKGEPIPSSQGEVFLKSREDMLKTTKVTAAQLDLTQEIVDKCTFQFEIPKSVFPVINPRMRNQMGDITDTTEYLRHLCLTSKRWPFDSDDQRKYMERIEHELKVIGSSGYSDYFIIVKDIMEFALRNNSRCGCGRGSVGGSLVAYLLHIHDAEPFEARLPFYRFLNPFRVQAPDIDIDFPTNIRDAVIDYIRDEFGDENVCHIGTCLTSQAKGCIQDWCRVTGIDKPSADRFSHTISDGMTFSQIAENKEKMAEVEAFLNKAAKLPRGKKPIDILSLAEGSVRAYGKHASGILISRQPLENLVPLFKNKHGDSLCSQYDMDAIDYLKMCKIDILGLVALDIINEICNDPRAPIDRDLIPMNDPGALKVINNARTAGLFQLGTMSFIRLLQGYKKRIGPVGSGVYQTIHPYVCKNIRDVMHLVALNRPGPKDYEDPDTHLNMIEEYILRMKTPDRISYLHPQMKPILEDTLGVIIYQEQIMQISRRLAGYDLMEADELRKFCAKKATENKSAAETEIIRKPFREKFIAGCLKNAIPKMTKEDATTLWQIVEVFGRYSFNASHSYCYAKTAMITAYLKAHHATAFLGATLKYEDDPTKKERLKRDASIERVKIHPPDINLSKQFMTWDGSARTIRMGFEDLKNSNSGSAKLIIDARGDTPFKDLVDFVQRCADFVIERSLDSDDKEKRQFLNRDTIIRLAWIGAFNSIIPGPDEGKEEFACSVLCSEKLPTEFIPPEDRRMEKMKDKKYVTDSLERHADIWVRLHDLGYNAGIPGLLEVAKANKKRKTQVDLMELYNTWPDVLYEEDVLLREGTLMTLYGHTILKCELDKYEEANTIFEAKDRPIAKSHPDPLERITVKAYVAGDIRCKECKQNDPNKKANWFVTFEAQDEIESMRVFRFGPQKTIETLRRRISNGTVLLIEGAFRGDFFEATDIMFPKKKEKENATQSVNSQGSTAAVE